MKEARKEGRNFTGKIFKKYFFNRKKTDHNEIKKTIRATFGNLYSNKLENQKETYISRHI